MQTKLLALLLMLLLGEMCYCRVEEIHQSGTGFGRVVEQLLRNQQTGGNSLENQNRVVERVARRGGMYQVGGRTPRLPCRRRWWRRCWEKLHPHTEKNSTHTHFVMSSSWLSTKTSSGSLVTANKGFNRSHVWLSIKTSLSFGYNLYFDFL